MTLQQLLQQKEFSSFIDGEFIKLSKSKQVITSPVNNLPWKTISQATKKQIATAIDTAEHAFYEWKKTTGNQRGKLLRSIANLMNEERQQLAYVMAMEMGKPIKEGLKEVDYAAGFFTWFASQAEQLAGQMIPSSNPDKQLMIFPTPIGVCGIITPWNFPLAMGARKLAAALAAGCTAVIKPSPECPISMLLLAKICANSGIPKGVINVLLGDEQEIGQAFLQSNLIRKLSFTGSTEIGRYLYRESAQTLKKLTLELGGHAPLIVFDDASVQKAVTGTISAKFRNNGQTCIAANRILVQKKIYADYVEKLVKATKKLVVGSPLDNKTDLSNVLHPSSQAKVQEHIRDALNKKAKALLLGESACFPTILENVNPTMKIFHEETFGPVVAITKFNTQEEAISLANQSEYGLAAYIFSENLAQNYRTIEALNYGIIGVNDGLPSAPQASFGGMKDSGFGREGGPTGIFEYLTEKFVSMSL